MLTLPEGTKKYLLLDPERIARNAERTTPGQPVVIVAEVGDAGVVVHRGLTVEVVGPTTLEYSQRTPLPLVRGMETYAAWLTTGEVRLETGAAAPTTTTPKPTRKRKPDTTEE